MIREESKEEIIRKTDENSKSGSITQIKRLSYSSGNSSDENNNSCDQFNEVLKKEGIENFSDLQRKMYYDDSSNLIKTVEILRKKYFTDEELKILNEAENKIIDNPKDIQSLMRAGNVLKEISLRLLECKNEEEVIICPYYIIIRLILTIYNII